MAVKITGTGTVDASLASEVMAASGIFGKSGMELLPEGSVLESAKVASWQEKLGRDGELPPTLSPEELKQEMRYNLRSFSFEQETPSNIASESEVIQANKDVDDEVKSLKENAKKQGSYSIQKTLNGSQLEHYSYGEESVFVLKRNDGKIFSLNNKNAWNGYRTLEEDGSVTIAFPTTGGVITEHNFDDTTYFDVSQSHPTKRQPLSTGINGKKGFIGAVFNPDGKIQVLAIEGKIEDHQWLVKMPNGMILTTDEKGKVIPANINKMPNEMSEADKSVHLKAMSKMEQGQEGYRLQDMVDQPSHKLPKQQTGSLLR